MPRSDPLRQELEDHAGCSAGAAVSAGPDRRAGRAFGWSGVGCREAYRQPPGWGRGRVRVGG